MRLAPLELPLSKSEPHYVLIACLVDMVHWRGSQSVKIVKLEHFRSVAVNFAPFSSCLPVHELLYVGSTSCDDCEPASFSGSCLAIYIRPRR